MGVTPGWDLPYPDPTDQYCDGPEFTQNLAEAVDSLLCQVFDPDLASAQVKPLARITRTTSQQVRVGTGSVVPVAFDTVDFDTGGLANLGVDASSVLIPPNSPIFQSGGFTDFVGTAVAAGAERVLRVVYGTGSLTAIEAYQRSPGSSVGTHFSVGTLDGNFNDQTRIALQPQQVSGTTGDEFTGPNTTLWVMPIGTL